MTTKERQASMKIYALFSVDCCHNYFLSLHRTCDGAQRMASEYDAREPIATWWDTAEGWDGYLNGAIKPVMRIIRVQVKA